MFLHAAYFPLLSHETRWSLRHKAKMLLQSEERLEASDGALWDLHPESIMGNSKVLILGQRLAEVIWNEPPQVCENQRLDPTNKMWHEEQPGRNVAYPGCLPGD